nr:MAG TPA: hypothetical protein [Caudoviricetes sp.]
MRTFENKSFIVEIERNKVIITSKKFGDVYCAEITNSGKLVAGSSLALKYAMNLRTEFGF